MIKKSLLSCSAGIDDIEETAVSSVVPDLNEVFNEAVVKLFGKDAVFINIKMNSGLGFPIDEPAELGADLLANAAAALHLYHRDIIVVDFGTAVSFTVVRKTGFVPGIVIAPGVISALGSLFNDTSMLPEIELKVPEKVIGTETVGCIQSGMIHGYTGLVENIIKKIDEEQGTESMVIAAGGSAMIFEGICGRIDLFDQMHTLKGIQLIHSLISRP
jgi:type III pantothenate kinase